MIVLFYPDVNKDNLNPEAVSEISWQRLHDYLEKAFCINHDKGERLSSIIISEYGIKANIDKKGK